MIEMFHWDMFTWIYLTGVVTLSLIFYFVYDRFEEKTLDTDYFWHCLFILYGYWSS